MYKTTLKKYTRIYLGRVFQTPLYHLGGLFPTPLYQRKRSLTLSNSLRDFGIGMLKHLCIIVSEYFKNSLTPMHCLVSPVSPG